MGQYTGQLRRERTVVEIADWRGEADSEDQARQAMLADADVLTFAPVEGAEVAPAEVVGVIEIVPDADLAAILGRAS